MTLLMLMLIPLIGALIVAFSAERQARWLALAWSVIALGATVIAAATFNWSTPELFQFQGSWQWVRSMGIELSVGADAVSLMLIMLTGLLGPICILASFTAIKDRQRLYYAALLILQTAMVGVFASRDLVLFYLSFEFTLAPMYVLISQWGSSNRKKAATKFFLYTFTGSMLALAGLVYVAWRASVDLGEWTFQIAALQEAARDMSGVEQAWVLFAMLAGFAVKVPLFPVHTWLPLAHTEAPTAGSVILAGVLLKLGTYGLYRFTLPFVPAAVIEYAPAIAIVAIIGIIYAGLICWVQTDIKKLVAYSSVSHLGFCVLGLVALNPTGLAGSVAYMLNHGLSTGALFLMVGFMYERYHTRSLNEVGGLGSKMPLWSFFMVFFTLASVGLPGLNGFIGEFFCMFGAFQSGATWGQAGVGGPLGPWYAAIAATGVIVAAIYLLFMVGKIVFGPLREPADHHEHPELPTDLSGREILTLAPLAILCLALGVYPKMMLKPLEKPVGQTLALIEEARPAADETPEVEVALVEDEEPTE